MNDEFIDPLDEEDDEEDNFIDLYYCQQCEVASKTKETILDEGIENKCKNCGAIDSIILIEGTYTNATDEC